MSQMNVDSIAVAAGSWLENHADEIFDCLGEWVSCNSVTPHELVLQRDLAEPFMREQLGLDEVALVNVCVGVYFGPGDCSMGVHGPNEFVPLSQVLECAQVLAAMIVDWCG